MDREMGENSSLVPSPCTKETENYRRILSGVLGVTECDHLDQLDEWMYKG